MKKIKVIQVITRMDWGGSPDIVRILYNYLNKEIYDLKLVMGRTTYSSANSNEFLAKIKEDLIVIPQMKRDINLFDDFISLLKLYFIFLREKPDVVHTHTAKAGALGRVAAYLAGVPVIVHTPHGHNFYGYFNYFFTRIVIFIERFLTNFTNKIIALTELEKKDYLKFAVAKEEKVVLIYSGLELDKYSGQNIDKNSLKASFNIGLKEVVVGMVGRLEPVKGPEYFIKAALKVAEENKNVKFILIGEGSLRPTVEKIVIDSEFKEKFIFTGWRDDVANLMSILDILVLPSLNEAVGMVLIEAQSRGIPVVATRVGGVPEVVKNRQTGILVPAQNSLALAEAIKFLLQSSLLRQNIGQAGKQWVKDRFTADIMVNSVSFLYRDLLKKRGL